MSACDYPIVAPAADTRVMFGLQFTITFLQQQHMQGKAWGGSGAAEREPGPVVRWSGPE